MSYRPEISQNYLTLLYICILLYSLVKPYVLVMHIFFIIIIVQFCFFKV